MKRLSFETRSGLLFCLMASKTSAKWNSCSFFNQINSAWANGGFLECSNGIRLLDTRCKTLTTYFVTRSRRK
ncbi:hypothetical protein PGB90_000833 [Kerria lacca]